MTAESLEARIARVSTQLEQMSAHLPALIQIGKTQVTHSTILSIVGAAVIICFPVCIGWAAFLHKNLAQTELEIAVLKTQMRYYETLRDIQTLQLPDGSSWGIQGKGQLKDLSFESGTPLEGQSTF